MRNLRLVLRRCRTTGLVLSREDAEQRDDEIQRQIRLEIVMRLVAPGGQDAGRDERRVGDVSAVDVHAGLAAGGNRKKSILWRQRLARASCRHGMGMSGQLLSG